MSKDDIKKELKGFEEVIELFGDDILISTEENTSNKSSRKENSNSLLINEFLENNLNRLQKLNKLISEGVKITMKANQLEKLIQKTKIKRDLIKFDLSNNILEEDSMYNVNLARLYDRVFSKQ